MPRLQNNRHEIFAWNVAHGVDLGRAYSVAGFRDSHSNAHHLLARDDVAARVQECTLEHLEVVRARSMVTAERVLAELARIALSDVTQAIEVKKGKVKIRDTDELTADQRAAISEIRQGRDGVTVKFHDKPRALETLAKHLQLTRENVDVNVNISLADLVNGSYQIERGEITAPEAPAIGYDKQAGKQKGLADQEANEPSAPSDFAAEQTAVALDEPEQVNEG